MRLSPGLGRAEFLVRNRFVLIGLLSTALAVRTAWQGPSGFDYTFFRLAALVFAGRPEDVAPSLFFAGPASDASPLELYQQVPTVQIGPVPLTVVAPLALWLPQQVAVVVIAVLCALALPLCLHMLERAADAYHGPDAHRPLVVLAAGAVCLLLWPTAVGRYVHPDDVLLLVAACAALLAAGRQRWIACAVLLGIAAGAKPWGAALLPLAMAGTTGAKRIAALGLAGVVAILPWLPFVLGAPGTVSALSQFHIFVGQTSPLSLVWSGGQVPPWLRPIQVGLGGFAVVLTVLRRRPLLAVALVVAIRVSTEGQDYDYYFAVLAVAAVSADLAVRGRRFPWTTTILVLLIHDARWLVSENWQVAYVQASLVLVIVATAVLSPPPRRWPRRPAVAAPRPG
ncbi:hypothetical protein [Kineococcus sp. SYSU DK003]|uniref:hypothetical protein n=1 Tax=Kineococcus sp. SYSU DK003 TaxID=3383124 RepID=UPI003D7E8F3A